jgi:hypothetical protein
MGHRSQFRRLIAAILALSASPYAAQSMVARDRFAARLPHAAAAAPALFDECRSGRPRSPDPRLRNNTTEQVVIAS